MDGEDENKEMGKKKKWKKKMTSKKGRTTF